jgi:hypothetical protein
MGFTFGLNRMTNHNKQISPPSCTGDVGGNFETEVGTAFVTLMLTGGFVPTFQDPCIVKEIMFQKRDLGYCTDDLIVFVERPGSKKVVKLLCQVRRSIDIGKNKDFKEIIQAAWSDFTNTDLFTKGRDSIALITSTLSKTDIHNVREILEWARHRNSSQEFITDVTFANYSSQDKITKLNVFRELLKNANNGFDVSDEDLWEFMKSFHLLGYDLDVRAGVTLSLLQSLIAQYSPENAYNLWTDIFYEVKSYKQNGGTIKRDSLPETICSAFQKPGVATIPTTLGIKPSAPVAISVNNTTLAIANLLGGWDENV